MSLLKDRLQAISDRAKNTNPIDALLAYLRYHDSEDYQSLTEALKDRETFTNKAIFDVLQESASEATNNLAHDLYEAVKFNTIIKYRQAL